MREYKRKLTQVILERLRGKRRFIQVIMGPRQVGKTTAILQVLKDVLIEHHYAAADLPAPPETLWISQQWDLARLKARGNRPVILVLDEVQKIHQWSTEVKRLWDEDTRDRNKIHVVLLGSSSMLLQKGLNESMAGRFEIIRFTHWSWEECRDGFGWTLDQYLYFGGYPGGAQLIDDEKRWAQYIRDALIETAISKDIMLLNRVEKPILLRRLFVMACEYAGQILSYQKIMGQLTEAGNTTTLAHYQSLLESAFLIQGLPKWSGTKIRQRGSSPKWLPLNTGLVTALANRSFNEYRKEPETWGRLVEVAVGAHLANNAYLSAIKVFYWREGNNEVDFILQKGKALIAIEVKSGKTRRALSTLADFNARYPVKRTLIVGSTELGLKQFLETPIEHWFN